MMHLRNLSKISATAANRRFASSLAAKVDESISSLPLREAIRYTKKNLKWTAGDVKKYAESHANALLEQGFKTGDSIAVWLPESAEKHITLLAAAKAGFTVYDIDTAISTVPEVRHVLSQTKVKAIIFEPTSESVDYLKLLRKSIPEFFDYDDSYGQNFHSKHFPALQYFIQTGPDIENGCLNYKALFLPNPATNYAAVAAASVKDDTPFYSKVALGPSGAVDIGPVVTQAQALDTPAFGFAKKLITRTYFELAA